MDEEEKQDDNDSHSQKSNTSNETLKETKSESAIGTNETIAKSETVTNSSNPKNPPATFIDLEWKNTQYFLAEAASAPKHYVRYNTHEQLSKLMSAYKEQPIMVGKQLSDEPSCSAVLTAKLTNSDVNLKNTHRKAITNENSETTKFLKVLNEAFERNPEIVKPSVVVPLKQSDIRLPLESSTDIDPTPAPSVRSIGSLVCRICHNSENPERLISPCLCKGSLSFVHIYCLERWISTSRSTVCELCQFQYNTEQTLRYTFIQSLRMWYSRSMSRRALQEDCQMFSLLTLVAFGIIGTLLVGIQYYFIQGRHWGLSSMWTKGWLLFFLFTTLLVYFINIYMIVRSQLAPWYRWWQSARDIKLILENRKPFKILPGRRVQKTSRQPESQAANEQQLQPPQLQSQSQPPFQSPIVPQILPTATSPTSQAPQAPQATPPVTPSTPPSTPVHATADGFIVTEIPSMHNKTSTNDIDILKNGNVGKPDAGTMSMMSTTKSITTTATTTTTSTPTSTPTLNKLQISVELTTTTPTEIIETSPLEDYDRCAFDYVTAIV